MRLWAILAGVVVGVGALTLWSLTRSSTTPPAPPIELTSPIQAKQQELLEQNIGRPGDPDLMGHYLTVNTRHFNGALPPVPVRWEPALAGVGALATPAFTLEGMFGRVGKDLVILINPNVKDDPQALDRALSHEMAHLYLFTTGDLTTNHGPAFKSVLARLARDGAFEGVSGSDEDKTALRAWLDAESTRLDMDQRELERIGADIAGERDALEAQVAALNARSGAGDRPLSNEVEALEARRERFNQIVVEANARIERGRDALKHFNDEVTRYNLMLVYPDGMDEEARPIAGRAP